MRALHKDRAHALAHYRHLLNSGGAGGLEAAASERPRTLERLIDIDRAVNQSMTMLKRYPELSNKISQLMNDYILALRSKDDIPGSSLGMSEDAEAAILDKYRIEIERKVAEKERLRLAEKQRKEQRAAEREKLREEKLRLEAKKVDDMVKAEQDSQAFTSEESKTSKDESMVDPTKMAHSDKDSAAEEYVEATLRFVTHNQTFLHYNLTNELHILALKLKPSCPPWMMRPFNVLLKMLPLLLPIRKLNHPSSTSCHTIWAIANRYFVCALCTRIYLKPILFLYRASLCAENSLIHHPRMRIKKDVMSTLPCHLLALLLWLPSLWALLLPSGEQHVHHMRKVLLKLIRYVTF